jgi:hypothetical protein
MAECPSAAADRHFADQEAANEAACYGTALENGFTVEQAKYCDDGDKQCVGCPFYSPFEKGDPENQWAVFTRRTNQPKLNWLMLRLREFEIPHREHGHSFHAPVLWVRKGDIERAWAILNPVDDVPDDDPMFEGGE